MLHAHARVPFVEPLQEDGLQLKRVVVRRVRDAHHFREDEQHEEVVLITPGAGDGASVRGVIELGGQIGPSAKCPSGGGPRQCAFSSQTRNQRLLQTPQPVFHA